MNIDIEPVMNGLLAALQNAVTVNFTAAGTANSPVLANVSTFTGLFTGLPVFGPGAPRGATILSFDALAQTVTLDQNVTATNTGASFKTGFLTISRRVQWWDQCDLPALFLRHIGDDDDYNSNQMGRTTLNCQIFIYSKAGEDPDVAPDTALNNLAKAARATFAPDLPGTRFYTIGGLCFWARIEGRSKFDPGDADKYAKAMLPVRITLP